MTTDMMIYQLPTPLFIESIGPDQQSQTTMRVAHALTEATYDTSTPCVVFDLLPPITLRDDEYETFITIATMLAPPTPAAAMRSHRGSWTIIWPERTP